METIKSKWFSTRDQQITWAVSLVFLIIFPIYFANMASFLPDNAVVGSGGSAGSVWYVELTETNQAEDSETVDMVDGEIFELEFNYNDMVPNIAYVEIIVTHDETNERGPTPGPTGQVANWPDQCDTVDVELNMEGVEGWQMDTSTTSSSSSDCPSEQVLRVEIIENYSLLSESMSTCEGKMSTCTSMYNDGNQGRGEWAGDITLTVNTGGPNGAAGNRDDGESVTIEWRVVSVDVVLIPDVNIEA